MTYDEVGNVLTRQDSLISKTETFEYDAVNRLINAYIPSVSDIDIYYSAAGRITEKSGCSGGTWGYGSGTAGPFAVTSACGQSFTYDANGRMITRGSGEIDWTSYDLPSKIDDLSDSSYTEFWYGPDRSRIQQYQSSTGATITYAGLLFEFEDAATDTYRHYVQAGDKVIAVVERVSTTNTKQFLHRDHQGSVTKVTNASDTVDQALAFDAWGLRRNAADWSALGSPFAGSHEIERGYTGHEHLDPVGLIHMNGRVQDPILGRFISADPLIQSPYSTQSHNRYSYVWNNPASFTDPSGFICTGTDMSGCTLEEAQALVHGAYAAFTDMLGAMWDGSMPWNPDAYFGELNGFLGASAAYVAALPEIRGATVTIDGVPQGGVPSGAGVAVAGVAVPWGTAGEAAGSRAGTAAAGAAGTLGAAIGLGVTLYLNPSQVADGTLTEADRRRPPSAQIFRVVNAVEYGIIMSTNQFPPSLSGFGEKQFWLQFESAARWAHAVENRGWESNVSIVSVLVSQPTIGIADHLNEPSIGPFISFGPATLPILNREILGRPIYTHTIPAQK